MLNGTLQFFPSPELLPISISNPVPKYAFDSTFTFFPIFLNIFLTIKYLIFLILNPIIGNVLLGKCFKKYIP
jgi:hypothetical protein